MLLQQVSVMYFMSVIDAKVKNMTCIHYNTYSILKDWDAHTLLKGVANHDPPFHALIDTGALITGRC